MGLWVGKNFLAHGDVISLINNWDDFNEYETNDCTCKQVPGDVNSWASQEHWSPTNNDASTVILLNGIKRVSPPMKNAHFKQKRYKCNVKEK